jgi:hypothetical protein
VKYVTEFKPSSIYSQDSSFLFLDYSNKFLKFKIVQINQKSHVSMDDRYQSIVIDTNWFFDDGIRSDS